MIRLLLRLLKIKDFEPCASCATLIKQLEFANAEKQQLTETLIAIIKPRTYEAPPAELNPIANSSMLFSKRRAAAEQRDRAEAQIMKKSTAKLKRKEVTLVWETLNRFLSERFGITEPFPSVEEIFKKYY